MTKHTSRNDRYDAIRYVAFALETSLNGIQNEKHILHHCKLVQQVNKTRCTCREERSRHAAAQPHRVARRSTAGAWFCTFLSKLTTESLNEIQNSRDPSKTIFHAPGDPESWQISIKKGNDNQSILGYDFPIGGFLRIWARFPRGIPGNSRNSGWLFRALTRGTSSRSIIYIYVYYVNIYQLYECMKMNVYEGKIS